MNIPFHFVTSLVTNEHLTEGKVYRVVQYDANLNAVLIANENPLSPFTFIDFPMSLFTPYESSVINVDFKNRKRAA